jgi:dihydroorotate dehydrogenase electron transfer subunit
MKQFQLKAGVKENSEVCPGVFRLTFISREIAGTAGPGQFLMVRVARPPAIEPVLRRPFSIHRIDDEQVSILFKVVGRGTEILSREINEIDLLGPLGNGYTIPAQGNLALIGGGLGIAPLLFLAQRCQQQERAGQLLILLGAGTATDMPAIDDFRQLGLPVKLATDDGSAGHHGFVPELMADNMEKGDWSVMTCGPQPMMAGVARQCAANGWQCQVSLETTMACGMGACLGCAVQGRSRESYLHVCKDGPVFAAEDVVF